MKTYRIAAFSLLALLLVLAGSPSALARKDSSHGKSGHESKHYNGDDDRDWRHDSEDDDDRVTIAISLSDRAILQRYGRESARSHCPPGLAKKNPPCVPPGQAKKWRIGASLPGDVVFAPIPDFLDLHPPAGYQYIQVDRDILLIGEATKKVIDAVTLLSAVEN